MIAYHITPYHTYQTKIKRHGLMPRIGARSKNIGESVERIYLFDSLDECDNALMNWLGDEYEDMGVKFVAILEINLDGIEVQQNPHAPWEYWALEHIPPERIKMIKRETIIEEFIVPNLRELFLTEAVDPLIKNPNEKIGVPRFLYHATMESNIDSIMKQGLAPRRRLSDLDDDKIYFSQDRYDNLKMMWKLRQSLIKRKMIKRNNSEDWIVLRIDTQKIPNIDFYQDSESWTSIYAKQPIPSLAIAIVDQFSSKDLLATNISKTLDTNWDRLLHIQEVFLPAPSSDIKSPKITIDKNMKPLIGYDDAWRMYNKYGLWYEDILEYIPIDKIDMQEVWNKGRYKDNTEWLIKTGRFPPIRVGYNEEMGKYEIGDGIHRTNVARDMGYTHIPAIASYKRTTPPPTQPPQDMEDMESVLEDIVNDAVTDGSLPEHFCTPSSYAQTTNEYVELVAEIGNWRSKEKKKDDERHFLILRFGLRQDGNWKVHGVTLVDSDRNVIDSTQFESTMQNFEKLMKRRIKMIYEKNKEVFA